MTLKYFFRLCACIGIVILLSDCFPSSRRYYLSELQLSESYPPEASSGVADLSYCRNLVHYTPDSLYPEHTPVKYLRVNFHVMRREDGSGNFPEPEGERFILDNLRKANEMLASNAKMKLPVGNKTPVLPLRLQYVLTPHPDDPEDDGIYFHNDEELYYLIGKGKDINNYDRRVFEKYGVQKDSVLNIFIMGYHADSLRSPNYALRVRGIGFDTWAKVSTWYHHAYPETQKECLAAISRYDINYAHSNLNHEIGHVLGLRHAWMNNDGCDDTPPHANCWTQGAPPCDGPTSNNIMDYSASPQAWTPCQIATIHRNLAQEDRKTRQLLEPNWCTFKPDRSITIHDEVVWNGAKDLEGHLIIKAGGKLTLRCRLSLPAGAKIEVHPGGELILKGARLHNACNDRWKGIEVVERGKKRGKVVCLETAEISDAEHKIKLVSDSTGN